MNEFIFFSVVLFSFSFYFFVGGKHGSRHHGSSHHHGSSIPTELVVGALNGGHHSHGSGYASNYGGGYSHGGIDTATIVSAALGGKYIYLVN